MSNRIYGTRTDINEQEVRDFYNKRAALASSMKNPLSYVGDAVGLGTRLTLDQIHSDQLDSDYSAIYRTAEEYVKLYSIFTKQGFHFDEQTYFPPEINGTRYNDSDRWYAILKR